MHVISNKISTELQCAKHETLKQCSLACDCFLKFFSSPTMFDIVSAELGYPHGYFVNASLHVVDPTLLKIQISVFGQSTSGVTLSP